MTALPGILAEIARVAGEDAALAIAAVRGGTQIYVPPVPAQDHWLCRLIGRERAKAVCYRLTDGVGPLRVDLPLGPTGAIARNRAVIDQMIQEDRSERDIALATGYTGRGIRKRRRKLGLAAETRQMDLF